MYGSVAALDQVVYGSYTAEQSVVERQLHGDGVRSPIVCRIGYGCACRSLNRRVYPEIGRVHIDIQIVRGTRRSRSIDQRGVRHGKDYFARIFPDVAVFVSADRDGADDYAVFACGNGIERPFLAVIAQLITEFDGVGISGIIRFRGDPDRGIRPIPVLRRQIVIRRAVAGDSGYRIDRRLYVIGIYQYDLSGGGVYAIFSGRRIAAAEENIAFVIVGHFRYYRIQRKSVSSVGVYRIGIGGQFRPLNVFGKFRFGTEVIPKPGSSYVDGSGKV